MDVEFQDSVVANYTSISAQTATQFDELWHPYVILYIGHVVAAIAAVPLSLYLPRTSIGIMVGSGLIFLIGAITGWPTWGFTTSDFIWWGVLIKWLIVNALATVPVLVMRAFKPGQRAMRIMGIFVYTILGSNILWTLGLDSKGMVVVYLNRCTAVVLTTSLILHCASCCRWGQELFEVRRGMVYGFGTSFPWIVCYTTWNALFIAKVSIGTTLQDILFWAMMYAYQCLDRSPLPIEFYFGFARPVQLGTYIAFAEWVGTLVPYFYEAKDLKEHQPLPVNSHAFFLFVCFANLVWGCVELVWSAQRLTSEQRFNYFVRNCGTSDGLRGKRRGGPVCGDPEESEDETDSEDMTLTEDN